MNQNPIGLETVIESENLEGALIGVRVVGYAICLWRNNEDEINEKCAREICDYILTAKTYESKCFLSILRNYERILGQESHVLSLIPDMLIEKGISKVAATETVRLIPT